MNIIKTRRDLAAAFGLPTEGLRRFTLVVEPDAVPTIAAEYMVIEGGKVAVALREFRIEQVNKE